MSVRHSWRIPSPALKPPERARRQQSKRISTTFDPDSQISLTTWQQESSNWPLNAELDVELRPSVSMDEPNGRHTVRLTFLEDRSEQDMVLRPEYGNTYEQQQSSLSKVSVPLEDDRHSKTGKSEEAGSQNEMYAALSLPLWREVAFVTVICLSMFTTQVGLGQVMLLLSSIGKAFDLHNPGDLSWLVAGYSLTIGSFILISGRLGDIYGYKLMLIIGYLWFAIWSLISGLSIYERKNGYIMFVFARVLSGIGPAITMPNGLAIFGCAYPDGMRKAMAFALFGACAPSGSVVGGAFAALFDLTWWPWTFFSFAIVLVVLALLCVIFVPSIPIIRPPPKTWRETIQALDLLGGVVGVTSLILINFAWNQAVVVGWRQEVDYVYILLIVGVFLVPCFFIIEIKVAAEPLIPFSALTSDVGFVMACIACGWACFGIWLFYLLQIYVTLRHSSPLQTAAWFSPIAASGFAASVTTGFILSKVRSSIVMVMSMSFFTIGVILVATAPVEQTYWAQTFVCSLVMPWGMDMSFPAGTIIMSASIPKQHQGVAASLINTVVNYSISIGLGFAGTVELQVDHGGNTEEENLLRGYRGALYLAIGLAGLGLATSLIFAVKQAFNDPKRKRRSTSSRLPDK